MARSPDFVRKESLHKPTRRGRIKRFRPCRVSSSGEINEYTRALGPAVASFHLISFLTTVHSSVGGDPLRNPRAKTIRLLDRRVGPDLAGTKGRRTRTRY